jgi:predicted RecB family nuclease
VGSSEKPKFHSFVAEEVSNEAEKQAWQKFWEYIRSLPQGEFSVFYYSKYERTQYRVLQKKYPDVISEDDVEAFFGNEASLDLYYDLVNKKTEWPTYNYSVKTLAQHLGFNWRDSNPSGAASIQWFNEWCKDRSPEKLQRILDYNEDDCIAMLVLKDELVKYAS